MKITKKLGCGFIGALMALCMCLTFARPVQVLAADKEVSAGSAKESATNISYDASYIAHHTAENTDYFSFKTPKKNGYTSLNVKNISINDVAWISPSFWIHIYTENDELMCERGLCRNNESADRVKLEADTTYYVVVTTSNDHNYEGNYRFSLSFFEDKEGDTKDTANKLTLKQEKTGSIEKAQEDKDWFSFTAGSYEKYQVTVKNLSADGRIWSNVYSKYDEEMGNCGAGTGNEEHIELTNLTPGDTYYIQIVGESTGNYRLSVKPVTTSIKETGMIASVKTSVEYNGKAQTPAVSVKFNGTSLKKGKDYKLQYSNNKNIGTATVKVIGIGNYDGTQKLTFKILPKKQNTPTAKSSKKNTVSVKWKSDKAVTGYYVQYSKDKNFKSGVKKVTVNKKGTANTTIKGLKSKSTYYVRVASYKKVSGKTYIGKYSTARKIKVK